MKGYKQCNVGHFYEEDIVGCPYCIDPSIDGLSEPPPEFDRDTFLVRFFSLISPSSWNVWIVWLVLVCLWNFGWPYVPPILDVIAAVILSLIANILVRKMENQIEIQHLDKCENGHFYNNNLPLDSCPYCPKKPIIK